MKKLLILILFLFFLADIYSQEKKSYKGEYQGAMTKGIATYDYLENSNLERVYNGPFEFSSIEHYYGLKLLITGNYLNDKKNGNWTFKLTSQHPTVYYKTLSETVSGEYQNGDMIGKWNSILTFVPNNSKGSQRDSILKKSFFSFKNSKPCGQFYYFAENEKISGNFDSMGFLDGEWKINWKSETPFEEIRNYKNGVCYKVISRDLSTGEIIDKENNDSILNAFLKNNILQDTLIKFNGRTYKTKYVDEAIRDSIFQNSSFKKNEGIKLMYKAIAFWICSNNMECQLEMQTPSGDILDSNIIYEIERGSNPFNFPIEKVIIEFIKP
jgi:hypothetical protein